MANTNDATIEIDDESTVTVDVSDKPELLKVEGVDTDDKAVTDQEPKPTPKTIAKTAQQKPTPQTDEASVALTQAIQKATSEETARKAAEATAMSERQQREAAQRQAQQHQAEAATYKEQAEDLALASINSGIEGATREIAAYEAEVTRLFEAGEFAKAAAVNTKIAKASATLDRLEDAKANYEGGTTKKPTTEGRVEPQPQQLPPFEQYVSQMSPLAQTWLRAHPECVPASFGGNSTANAKMMRGHYAAIEAGYATADGSVTDKDNYFRVIEETAGYRAPVSAATVTKQAGEDEDVAEVKPVVKPKPKVAQPSAPVSREPPTAAGQVNRATRSVTLTREQQEAAKISFPQLKPQEAFAQYARNLLELESEGKMGRLTH